MRTSLLAAVLVALAVVLAASWTQAADAPKAAGEKAAAPKAQEKPKGDKPLSEDVLKKVEAALPDKPIAPPAKARKIIIFTMTKGFRHGSIPLAAKTLELMGEKTGAWQTTVTDDVNMFAADKLAPFDAVVSDQCTGNLTDDENLRKGLIDYVKAGHGLVGIHAATDVGGWKFPDFFEAMGGVFAGHPFRKISVKLDDPANPLNAMFDGKGFEISDEIYTFKDPYSREKLHILMSIDWENAGLKGGNRADNDYALSWTRRYGEGRVFFCAFGHDDAIWFNPAILKHYLAGIQYALGDLKADDTPTAKLSPAPQPARGPTLAPQPEKKKAEEKKGEEKKPAAAK